MSRMPDVFMNEDFRDGLVSAITPYVKDYKLPSQIPVLYRYSGFSEYAVKNLLLNGLSFSIIASFNDCYDSSISFGDFEKHAAQEYEKEQMLATGVGCQPVISREAWMEQISTEQLAYRNFSNDSYCCCFAQTGLSNLMWSHYASNCRGICVSYDFEFLHNHPLYYSLFPVAYSSVPIDIYEHIRNRKGRYSLEIGILVSILNKSSCWAYENEWRLVIINESLGRRKTEKYITQSDIIPAKCVLLGQRFLDNFINELSGQPTEKLIQQLKLFTAVQKTRGFQVRQVISLNNTFEQAISHPLSLDDVYDFIHEQYEYHELKMSNRDSLYRSYSERILKT